MRHFFLAIILTCWSGLSVAQDVANDAVKQVISAQIGAFQVDDFETAFSYASPRIREVFGSVERFGEMVQAGFPMVWRTTKVVFVGSRVTANRFFQTVIVGGEAGQLYWLEYEMIDLGEVWKINGVRFVPPPETGA